MPRLRHQHLRGSVTQNMALRARPKTSPQVGFAIRLGLLASSAALILGLFIWLWKGEWPRRQFANLNEAVIHLTQKARFSVRDVIVTGRQYTDKKDLLTALGTSAGDPIITLDLVAATNRIKALSWVESVVIERQYPDVILVRLTERVPIARWQKDGKLVVIDRNGQELPNVKAEQFSQLPMVVGNDAPAQTETLLTALKNFPVITSAMTSAVRVSERRWNLYLQPKILVRLPEEDMVAALARLARLIQDQKMLERDVVAIDLRLPDRAIFEPGKTLQPRPTGASNL